MRIFHLLTLLVYSLGVLASDTAVPPLSLANLYHPEIELNHYWVSEKYDGVRAYWDGEHLITRQGNFIQAPPWFLAQLPPKQPLDGELWLGRERFAELSALVRRHTPVDEQWKSVQYQIFDLPNSTEIFDLRLQQMQQILEGKQRPNLRVVRQFKLATHAALMQMLKEITQQGAEGLMLHRGDTLYQPGRSDALLKLKLYQDAEAKVIEHIPGKGRLAGILGAILVEDEAGRRFRLGSGFSDAERATPPPVGTIITYRYHGRTSSGLPRFARYLRIRDEQ